MCVCYSKEAEAFHRVTIYNSRCGSETALKSRHNFKGVSPNVDFYTVLYMEMLGIPSEIVYTIVFAIARIAGWSAHRAGLAPGDATKLFVQHIRVSWKNRNKIIYSGQNCILFLLCASMETETFVCYNYKRGED